MLGTDADRLAALESLGGSSDITVDGKSLRMALYKEDSRPVEFDSGVRVATSQHTLRCLWSDVREIDAGAEVLVPGVGTFYITAPPVNRAGLAVIELHKDSPS